MIRKNLRLKKEYLYAKSQEALENKKQEKRIKLQNAIENDKAMPTEYKGQRDEIEHDLELADKKTMIARSHVDDEYESA